MDSNNYLIAISASLITAVLSYLVQYLISENSRINQLRKEKITKLLLPLYIKLQEEEMHFSAELSFDNGDPGGFLADLPTYYESLVAIIEQYLYLADDELTDKALKFLDWQKTEKFRDDRYDEIMISGTNDVPLNELRKCVARKYLKEKQDYIKRRWFF